MDGKQRVPEVEVITEVEQPQYAMVLPAPKPSFVDLWGAACTHGADVAAGVCGEGVGEGAEGLY